MKKPLVESNVTVGANGAKGDLTTPFEWLTNFSSLAYYLNPDRLFPNVSGDSERQSFQVLHVGSGSSLLGEFLQLKFPAYDFVVNVDHDIEILYAMKQRWHRLVDKWTQLRGSGDTLDRYGRPYCGTMKYAFMDFQQADDNSDILQTQTLGHCDLDECPSNATFDLILDKSTLDCLLCSNDGAAGLICNIYKKLKVDGVYFCVSFHQAEFVKSLLEDCPGADWTVEQYVVPRKVDSPSILKCFEETLHDNIELILGSDSCHYASNFENEENNTSMVNEASAWNDGCFKPNEAYGRTVNVFICRRGRHISKSNEYQAVQENCLDFVEVNKHIHNVNDEYFKMTNPMVTHIRKQQLKESFLKKGKELGYDEGGDGCHDVLPLKYCYDVLFTEAEKEHLSYDYFLEDWCAFCEKCLDEKNTSTNTKDGMTFETAIQFLDAMQ